MSATDTLRERLRQETRRDHDRVDLAFSNCDISTRDGLVDFAAAHYAGFRAMEPASDPQTRQNLRQMASRLACDLKVLGAEAGPEVPSLTPAPHPLACLYVAAGSRMGTAVLSRKWQSTTDPCVRNANQYFSAPPVQGEWQSVCNALSKHSANGPEADAVIAGTKQLFDLFARLAPRHVAPHEGAA